MDIHLEYCFFCKNIFGRHFKQNILKKSPQHPQSLLFNFKVQLWDECTFPIFLFYFQLMYIFNSWYEMTKKWTIPFSRTCRKETFSTQNTRAFIWGCVEVFWFPTSVIIIFIFCTNTFEKICLPLLSKKFKRIIEVLMIVERSNLGWKLYYAIRLLER